MKMWAYVNGGYRATQDAWAQTAHQLRNYAYSRMGIPISHRVQAFEEVAPGDASGGTAPVAAPASQPARQV